MTKLSSSSCVLRNHATSKSHHSFPFNFAFQSAPSYCSSQDLVLRKDTPRYRSPSSSGAGAVLEMAARGSMDFIHNLDRINTLSRLSNEGASFHVSDRTRLWLRQFKYRVDAVSYLPALAQERQHLHSDSTQTNNSATGNPPSPLPTCTVYHSCYQNYRLSVHGGHEERRSISSASVEPRRVLRAV